MEDNEKVSRQWHYGHIKAWRYLVASAISIVIFVLLSLHYRDWGYLDRSGGLVCLFGAILGLRKLLRKGAREFSKPNEPWSDSSGKFNMNAMHQHLEDTSDSFAQELGLILVILGALIGALGSLVLQAVAPFAV